MLPSSVGIMRLSMVGGILVAHLDCWRARSVLVRVNARLLVLRKGWRKLGRDGGVKVLLRMHGDLLVLRVDLLLVLKLHLLLMLLLLLLLEDMVVMMNGDGSGSHHP